jgi:hypothetical protein
MMEFHQYDSFDSFLKIFRFFDSFLKTTRISEMADLLKEAVRTPFLKMTIHYGCFDSKQQREVFAQEIFVAFFTRRPEKMFQAPG